MFARSAPAPSGRGGAARRPSLLLFSLCFLLTVPGRASSQESPAAPLLSFRERLELEVLGQVSKHPDHVPSLRLTYLRRSSLLSSTSVSGLLLLDPLSTTVGVAVGRMRSFVRSRGLLEPFAEVGAAFADARVPSGSYEVLTGDNGGMRVVHRYLTHRGPAAVAGAGLSWTGMAGSRTTVRLSAGYWQLVGGGGFRHGSVLFGVSLGRGHRDTHWYALVTDHTPPVSAVRGNGAAAGDSVDAVDGKVRVLAADASGIAVLRVNGEDIPYGPADAASDSLLGTTGGAVMGTAWVHASGGEEKLSVEVRDSAGLTSRSTVWAHAGPDRSPPIVSTLVPYRTPDKLGPRFRAMADDPSGIADARIGVCPVELTPLPPDPVTLRPRSSTARLTSGWGAAGDSLTLTVRDRLGNVAHAEVPSVSPKASTDARPPRLEDLRATAGSEESGHRSIRVSGFAVDAAGTWIARVEVDGEPAVLRVEHDPSRVDFDGWLPAPVGADTVLVVATTADGRVARKAVPVETAGRSSEGRLYVLLVSAATDTGAAHLRALTRRAGSGDAEVLLGAKATPEAVLTTLRRLRRFIASEDAVLVAIGGNLKADRSASGPSLELATGTLDVARLGYLLRALTDGVTLVSSDFRPGPTWLPPPAAAPGAQPPAGCYDSSDAPPGRVLDLRGTPARRILTGLAGAADRNGDGRVSVAELVAYLDLQMPRGLLPFDPRATVALPGGDR